MERIETLNKIKAGTIRIENGYLIGLGVAGSESIDVNYLHRLFDTMGKFGVAESIVEVLSVISTLHAECCHADDEHADNKELLKFVNDNIRANLRDIDAFNLGLIAKTFSK